MSRFTIQEKSLNIRDWLLYNIQWTRIAIILVLFTLVVAFSAMLGERSIGFRSITFLAALGLVAVVFLQIDLSIAPVVILCTAAFVPFSLPTGTGSVIVASIPMTGLYIGLWLLKSVIIDRKIVLPKFPAIRWLWAFMIAACFSLVWGIVVRDPAVRVTGNFAFVQIASLAVMVLLPLSLMLPSVLVKSEKVLKAMVAVMIIAGFANLANSLLGVNLRVNGGGLFSMWIVALTGSLILTDRYLQPGIKLSLSVLLALYIYVGVAINISWLAGWLPGMIALGLILFLNSKKLFFGFLSFLPLFYLFRREYFLHALSSETKVSGYTRLAAWGMNWTVTREHLLFGTGPAGYTAYYMTYFPYNAMATHSNYIDLLSQTGIFGTLPFICFFIAYAIYGYRVWRRIRGRGDFLEALLLASLGGLAGSVVIMGFGDWIIPFAYTQTIGGFNHSIYTWLFLGTIPVVDLLTKNAPTKTPWPSSASSS